MKNPLLQDVFYFNFQPYLPREIKAHMKIFFWLLIQRWEVFAQKSSITMKPVLNFSMLKNCKDFATQLKLHSLGKTITSSQQILPRICLVDEFLQISQWSILFMQQVPSIQSYLWLCLYRYRSWDCICKSPWFR